MTGGQTSMTFAMEGETQRQQGEATIQLSLVRRASRLRVVLRKSWLHESRLDLVQVRGSCLAGVIYSLGYKNHPSGDFAATDQKVRKRRRATTPQTVIFACSQRGEHHGAVVRWLSPPVTQGGRGFGVPPVPPQ